MRAGQVMVSILGSSHTLLILPALSMGMFHGDWRIRHSSIVLLGDLLYMVGDTKAIGLAEGEEDDEEMGGIESEMLLSIFRCSDFLTFAFSTGSSRAIVSIRAHCGDALANSVFATLYIIRSDTASAVRQASLQVALLAKSDSCILFHFRFLLGVEIGHQQHTPNLG